MNNDTPMIDAALAGTQFPESPYLAVLPVARKLERENAELRDTLESIRVLCTTDHETKSAFINRVLFCLEKTK